jgi:ATP-dependent Lon protease
MPRNRKRQPIQKGITNMATQPAPLQLSVVPDAQTQKEIENTIDAPRILVDAIEEFKNKRADAETELAQSLSKDLAAGPLKVENAIQKLNATKSKQEAFTASIEVCKELSKIIEARIQELKQTQPEALRTAVQARLDQLEKEVAAEKEKEHLLREQINTLKHLLADLKGAGAKSKS